MATRNGEPREENIVPQLERERVELLRQLDAWLELPMVVLGFIWLAILVLELIWGISPFLSTAANTIWILFILDFALKVTLAPHKLAYIRQNWLTAISLALPALRVFRVVWLVRLLRTARAVRSLRLLRVLTSMNRGMKALRASMARRGAGYVVALTTLVTLAGAAGMVAFERGAGSGLDSYGVALWWTAMIMTTVGSEAWPKTAEGRVLGFLLSLYALGILGYVAATLATFFVGRDADDEQAELAGTKEISALHAEIVLLREEIRRLREDRQEHQEG